MTLSAAKRAYPFPDPEAYEPESVDTEPTADNVADSSDSHLDGWHELPCQIDAAEQQRLEDVQASFHEQLAVLVRALGSDDAPNAQGTEDSFSAELEPDEETETSPEEPAIGEGKPWYSDLRSSPLSSLRNVLDGRARGFIVGFGASIAAGGAVLAFANGIGEQPAGAGVSIQNDLPIITASAGSEAEPSLRATIMDEVGQGPTINAAAGPTNPSKAIAADGEPTTDHADTVPGTFVDLPVETENNGQPAEFTQPAAESEITVVKTLELDRGEGGHEEPSANVAITFETTIQPAAEERDPAAKSPTSEHPIGQTAHTVKHVNLRAGPDNSAAVLAIIPEGSPVEVIQCEHWCEVIAEGQRGWVYKDLIAGALADEVSSARSSG